MTCFRVSLKTISMAANISVKSSRNYPTNLLLGVRDQNPDLMLASAVATHKCVLSSLSPLVSNLLTSVDSTDTLTLVLPQVELIIIEKMVQLVYTGRLVLSVCRDYYNYCSLQLLDCSDRTVQVEQFAELPGHDQGAGQPDPLHRADGGGK